MRRRNVRNTVSLVSYPTPLDNFFQRFWPHVPTTIMTSEYVDGLVREYLLYRGFSNSLKTFDLELKSDRDKGLRPDKITEQLMAYVSASDIQG